MALLNPMLTELDDPRLADELRWAANEAAALAWSRRFPFSFSRRSSRRKSRRQRNDGRARRKSGRAASRNSRWRSRPGPVSRGRSRQKIHG